MECYICVFFYRNRQQKESSVQSNRKLCKSRISLTQHRCRLLYYFPYMSHITTQHTSVYAYMMVFAQIENYTISNTLYSFVLQIFLFLLLLFLQQVFVQIVLCFSPSFLHFPGTHISLQNIQTITFRRQKYYTISGKCIQKKKLFKECFIINVLYTIAVFSFFFAKRVNVF